jgi:hypothetical protein
MTDEAERSGREHKVRERAYKIWEDEGRPEGRHDDHWHQANSEFEDTPVADAAPDADAALDTAPDTSAGVDIAPAPAAPETAATPKRRAGTKVKASDATPPLAPAAKAARKPRTIKPKAV